MEKLPDGAQMSPSIKIDLFRAVLSLGEAGSTYGTTFVPIVDQTLNIIYSGLFSHLEKLELWTEIEPYRPKP
jgi:hypothetical protein